MNTPKKELRVNCTYAPRHRSPSARDVLKEPHTLLSVIAEQLDIQSGYNSVLTHVIPHSDQHYSYELAEINLDIMVYPSIEPVRARLGADQLYDRLVHHFPLLFTADTRITYLTGIWFPTWNSVIRKARE